MEARREAMAADVVVVNHHLFFADVMLRDDGVAELLPACNTVIFDEAHQLPETARLFFGENVSTRPVASISRATPRSRHRQAARTARPAGGGRALEKAARDLRLALPLDARSACAVPRRTAKRRHSARRCTVSRMQHLKRAVANCWKPRPQRGEGLENCWRRALRCSQAPRLRSAGAARANAEDVVRWVETLQRQLQLNCDAAVSRAHFPASQIGRPSARLDIHFGDARGEPRFRPLPGEMGLDEARHRRAGTAPSISRNRPCSTCRTDMPDAEQRRLHRRRGGRRAAGDPGQPRPRLHAVHQPARDAPQSTNCCRRRSSGEGLDFPLLLQGEGSRSELLERFRRLGNAVLVASQSFWEGVDVRGEALSLVVIDKLPFAPPDDPVLAARIEQMKPAGQQRLHGIPVAACGDHPEAGRRPADPRRDRSRRADDLRPAADRASLTAGASGRACRRCGARACSRRSPIFSPLLR